MKRSTTERIDLQLKALEVIQAIIAEVEYETENGDDDSCERLKNYLIKIGANLQ